VAAARGREAAGDGPGATAGAAAERYRTLLEINNALVTTLAREDLFRAIAAAVRRVVPFDRIAVFLHEPARDVLRLFVLESRLGSTYFTVGLEMGVADSHVGRVFREQRMLLRRDLAWERQYAPEDWAYADGVRSYVMVPLVARGTSIGTLATASTEPGRYSEADAAFLGEVAGQVALALANLKAYEDLAAAGAEQARLLEEMRRQTARRERAEGMLRAILEGTAGATGQEFFASLVRHLAAAIGVRYAFVAECRADRSRARTLAFWRGEGPGEDIEYDVTPTPCRGVLAGEVCHYPADLQALFPEDPDLAALGAQSYLGVPIVGRDGGVIGHLAVLDVRPMAADPRARSILLVFAARAGAELERLRSEEELRRALAEVERLKNRLHAENVYLQEEIRSAHDFTEMVGGSAPLLELLGHVERVAPTDATVLVLGETGTGKELVARALHDRSPRRDRPLVKVNCSAISAGLVESELFGHVKGAFTGAIERRVGRFELADGGTLFLDEIGELPAEAQAKLLRVLQEQEFEPVGSSRSVRVDVRLIAATNRDLEEAVRAGRFRSDLYYRLNVVPLWVPALRERREDIPQLALFFLARAAKRFGKPVTGLTPAALARLSAYAWPGNVRELQNVVERAVVLAPAGRSELGAELFPLPGGESAGPAPAPAAEPAGAGAPVLTLEELERRHILETLERTGWLIDGPRGAARLLALHPNTLRSRLQRLGIRRPAHGPS
jgi:transcriptional regulator with GAF, ATPase, and Fis domain